MPQEMFRAVVDNRDGIAGAVDSLIMGVMLLVSLGFGSRPDLQ